MTRRNRLYRKSTNVLVVQKSLCIYIHLRPPNNVKPVDARDGVGVSPRSVSRQHGRRRPMHSPFVALFL